MNIITFIMRLLHPNTLEDISPKFPIDWPLHVIQTCTLTFLILSWTPPPRQAAPWRHLVMLKWDMFACVNIWMDFIITAIYSVSHMNRPWTILMWDHLPPMCPPIQPSVFLSRNAIRYFSIEWVIPILPLCIIWEAPCTHWALTCAQNID